MVVFNINNIFFKNLLIIILIKIIIIIFIIPAHLGLQTRELVSPVFVCRPVRLLDSGCRGLETLA
jgi:hypothetical protein